VRYRAPGRVNIIGEHTDYNDGFVLPTTTAAYTQVSAERRADRLVRISSNNLRESHTFDLDDTAVRSRPEWFDYARGVAAELEAAGAKLPGADIEIDSNIPIGGGLSSSASFEVGIAVALLDLAGESLPKKQLAQVCRRAEIRYAGVNCGIMDQLAIAACEEGRAMLIDCRTLATQHVEIPDNARLLVVDSGVRHQLPESGYNDRAEECQDAVRILSRADSGVIALRDASPRLLTQNCTALGNVLFRRALHIVTENQRVKDAYAALEYGDLQTLGKLISDSHDSLRDDFEISCEAVDRLVEIADACVGALGARQIGGGFGGCVLCLTTADHVADVRTEIGRQYARITGSEPWMHVVAASSPAGKV